MLQELRSLVFKKKAYAQYLGFVGKGNLGDEAILLAIQDIFAKNISFYTSLNYGVIERFQRYITGIESIFLGGGTLIKGPSRHLKSINSLASIHSNANLIVFGTGVGDEDMWEKFGHKTDREAWRNTLNKSDYLSVRGPISKKYLQNWGIEKHIDIIGDPAIWLARDQVSLKKKKKRIGLNFGPSLGKPGQIHGQDEMYVLKFGSRLLEYLHNDGWLITLFPMAKADIDYLLQAVNMAGISMPQINRNYLDLNNTLKLLEKQDVFVGEKLHSVILASCVCTPSVMLEYRTKCKDFMLSIGREDWSFRTDFLDFEVILDSLLKLYEDVDFHQQKIHVQMMKRKDMLKEAAKKVNAIASKY